MHKKLYLLLAGLCLFITASGQNEKSIILAKNHLIKQLDSWNLTEVDITDVVVDNVYTSKHNGVTHIYFRQRYNGIKIVNAINTVNVLPNGEILYATNRFLPNIAKAVNTTSFRIDPETAIINAASHLNIKEVVNLNKKEQNGRNTFTFQNTNISNAPIKVNPVYQLMDDGKLHLAWEFAIDMTDKADYWNISVDALSGKILKKENWTTHCTFGTHRHTQNCGFLQRVESASDTKTNFSNALPTIDGSSYNVFAVPTESPAHGNRTMVSEPANLAASPFGWHDTNGAAGAEFTITRGNNAHAYADVDGRNSSNGNEPDGGTDLNFDYPFDQSKSPDTYSDAATTQLFYMTNMMHDIAYAHGFTEEAGNFQERNYNFPNGDGDYVIAEAQDDYYDALTLDSLQNNANFRTPPDGFNGRMQMYIWGRGGGRLFQVTAPEEIANEYESGVSVYGPEITTSPISGKVAVVNDGSFNPTLGCNDLINTEDIEGKIALVDRGDCFFIEKTFNAQNAGAIAVIICNFENSLLPLGAPSNFSGTITIPTIMLKRNDCQTLKASINNDDLEITLQRPPLTGPDFYDGDFDNGIIAHEYAHGISCRLTGGRSNASCLFNDEQMGEGWSDFFTLITSVKPGETGKEKRGIGTYVLRQENDAQGIRSFPYSTDMSISPYTYKNVIGLNDAPHPVGAVWTAMLWDLYWAMSEKHGWDADLFEGDGGNNMAIRLVMDGLKMQACRPGFIDGRDAIIAADKATNGGENECLIWEVFARRGLGYSAAQGDNRDRNDPTEAFDLPPTCENKLLLAKTATERINAGGEIEYTLTLGNYKNEKVTEVVLTDNLPEGLSFKEGSANRAVNAEGSNLRFEIPELAIGEEIEITYTATTDQAKFSTRQFYDDMENGDDFWLIIDAENTNLWGLQDVFFKSGENAWHVTHPSVDSEQFLQLDEEIVVTGEQPTLRFSHLYDIDEGTSGGLVEISKDGGVNWSDLGPHIKRNGYVGAVSYHTFAIPDLSAYWGSSEQFVDTYVDLSAYRGEEVIIRFRFGSLFVDNNNTPNNTYDGWFIDDVEFLDLVAYQSEACATSSEGDNVCAMTADGGTAIDPPTINTSVQDLEDLGLQFAVFPNPVGDYLNVSLSNEKAETGTISLYNTNGQVLLQKNIRIDQSTQIIPFNVSSLVAGFYIVKVQTNEGIAVKKVILE